LKYNETGVAQVTSASSGIGRASALALAKSGYLTYATARHAERMAGLEAPGLQLMPPDVADENQY